MTGKESVETDLQSAREFWRVVIAEQIRQAVIGERQACADLAEGFYSSPPWAGHYKNAGMSIAAAIRARNTE